MFKNPRLIFYLGFAIFLVGYASQFTQLKFLRILVLAGTAISIVGVAMWLRTSNFKNRFAREKSEDGLTFFWNKIVIRLWSAMFFSVMLVASLIYLLEMILN